MNQLYWYEQNFIVLVRHINCINFDTVFGIWICLDACLLIVIPPAPETMRFFREVSNIAHTLLWLTQGSDLVNYTAREKFTVILTQFQAFCY
jgi:hypothetical protein